MAGFTYDAGALIAAEAGSAYVWSFHNKAVERDDKPTVPAVVVAQVWRGGRQARLARLLRGCVIEVFDEETGRKVGVTLAAAGSADVVDVAVVLGALRRGDCVVTSDPTDLRRIAEALNERLDLRAV